MSAPVVRITLDVPAVQALGRGVAHFLDDTSLHSDGTIRRNPENPWGVGHPVGSWEYIEGDRG